MRHYMISKYFENVNLKKKYVLDELQNLTSKKKKNGQNEGGNGSAPVVNGLHQGS